MNNKCNRKCYWNYNGQCRPETDEHFDNGTATTCNCSEFLRRDFEEVFEKTLKSAVDNLYSLPLRELKEANKKLIDLVRKKDVRRNQPKQGITNADWIRSMSDEELAEYLNDDNLDCSVSCLMDRAIRCKVSNKECVSSILAWLKTERN